MPRRLIPKAIKSEFKKLTQQLVLDLSQSLTIVQESSMFVDCPNCFEKGTLIETPFGLKLIEDFEPGDFILDGNAEPRIVEKIFHKHVNCEFTSIKTHGNNIGISATSNHRLLVYENLGTLYKPILGKSLEKEINEISKGDIIYKAIRSLPDEPSEKIWIDWQINNYGPKKLLPKVLKVSDEFLFALGLYIAEGVTNKGRIVSYCLNDSEIEIGTKVCEYWKNIIDCNFHMYFRKETRNRVFEIYSSYLAKLLDRWCGHGAKNKKIPSSLYYKLDKRQTMILIFGLFVEDGHYEEKYGSAVLSTISRELAYQVYNLLLSCGYATSILSQPAKKDKDGIFRQKSFTVRYWLDENFIQRGTIRDDNIIYQVVKTVNINKKETPVWNLEVQTEHSYIADGFSVKNCVWDSINKKSSNVFQSSFTKSVTIFVTTDQERIITPIPFNVGRCPVCIGEGQLFTSKEVCIPAMINYLAATDFGSRYFDLPAGKEGTNYMIVKTLACHYELLFNNSIFVVHNNVKCEKWKPPFVRGLGGEDAICEMMLQTSEAGARSSGKFGGGDPLRREGENKRRIKGPTEIDILRGRLRGR